MIGAIEPGHTSRDGESRLSAGDPRRLSHLIADARRAAFVGRVEELELFRSALLRKAPETRVLLVHGPGGIGKTALLHEFASVAESNGAVVVRLDGRDLEPSPEAVSLALGRALGMDDGGSAFDCLAAMPAAVILLDTCEQLKPLDSWLREVFLQRLNVGTLVVFAGRTTPEAAWRAMPGWGRLIRAIELRNLSPDESRALLLSRGAPDGGHGSALEFTHGHPLALTLIADFLIRHGADTAFSPEGAPDIVRTLLEAIVEEVPDPDHRAALRLCAVARATNESLIASVLPHADPRALFDWLCGLSFTEAGPHGVFPHDLAREILDADFRWRDPSGYADLLDRMVSHVVERIRDASGAQRQQALLDGFFAMRDLPAIKPYYEWRQLPECYAEPAGTHDLPGILSMVRGHEGAEAARLAEYWYDRQPQAFTAVRGPGRRLIGFLALLELHKATEADREIDPAVRVAWEFAHRHSPPRAGEEMLHQRFWMDSEAYYRASVTYLVISSILSLTYVARPRLSWTFHPSIDPDYWAALMRFTNFTRCEAADFELEGRSYGSWVRDWRAEPAPEWLRGIARRALQGLQGGAVEAPPPSAPPLIALSPQEFGAAVRLALRDYSRPVALEASPLLRSRVLADHSGGAVSTAALQALLRAAAQTLRGQPRSEKFYRAVAATYFDPAPSQEKAAEMLGLPFNTYRYHLGRGLEHITTWLWNLELRGAGD